MKYRIWNYKYLDDDLDECHVYKSIVLPDLSLLSCSIMDNSSIVLCCGGNSKKSKGISFIGTPIVAIEV
jgi:hypothetical protein